MLITLTGADDSVRVEDLVGFSENHPAVEWGILVSHSQQGTSRFPSFEWIASLLYQSRYYHCLPLSLHLCGRWVREVCQGDWTFASRFGWLQEFQRVQLNFHAYAHLIDDRFIESARQIQERTGMRLIFQCDGVNDSLVSTAFEAGVDAVPLYDKSGGAGVVPGEWPTPIEGVSMHGYAGGLGPANIAEQMPRIIAAAKGEPYWIDCETRIRSDGDRTFDLQKCEQFVDTALGRDAKGGDVMASHIQENQLTETQAIELAKSHFWELMPPKEIAEFQLVQDRLCMPFDVFHLAVEEALGRPVWTHEFVLREEMLVELRGDAPGPTMQQIINMIPEEKRIVIGAPEEQE